MLLAWLRVVNGAQVVRYTQAHLTSQYDPLHMFEQMPVSAISLFSSSFFVPVFVCLSVQKLWQHRKEWSRASQQNKTRVNNKDKNHWRIQIWSRNSSAPQRVHSLHFRSQPFMRKSQRISVDKRDGNGSN